MSAAKVQKRAEKRAEKKASLLARTRSFSSEKFIARRVLPLVPEFAREKRGARARCSVEVVRAKGTGRLTLRYQFDDDVTLYAKVYTDELGPYSFQSLRALWEDGFGSSSEFHVPEPLGYHDEENFLLMRRAEGRPLAEMLAGGSVEELLPSVRMAARWLARLHASVVPTAVEESACERVKIFKLSDMLAKASAAYPAQSPLLLDLLQRVRRVAPVEGSARLVPTHGQYTPANVFLRDEETAVIDLDRICLSDPAKDVAMFVHRVRNILYKDSGDTERADAIAREFVEEYGKSASNDLKNLPYYTALFSLKGFAKIAKDRGPEDPARRPLEEFYLKEFARYLEEDEKKGTSRAVREGKERIRTGDELRGAKEELGRFAVNISDEDFIGRRVFPTLSRDAKPANDKRTSNCETTVVQNTGTGRLTLRYDFDAGPIVYAKLYTDGLGLHSYRINTLLWRGGFNRSSRYQVPEPLAFMPEHNLFLMRSVEGRPLTDALRGECDEFTLEDGAREAARWLAAFHRAPVRVGEAEADWDSLKIFRVCVRLIKAAAARPHMRAELLDLMHALKDRVHRMPSRRPLAQTHGRYHQDHVFISRDSVAVIDLDRSRPTDPAKDVGEFLRVLRMASFKKGYDMGRTDRATRIFLDEYLSLAPETAAGVPFYWSAFLWLSLFGCMKKIDLNDPRGRALVDFHMREMERAAEMKI